MPPLGTLAHLVIPGVTLVPRLGTESDPQTLADWPGDESHMRGTVPVPRSFRAGTTMGVRGKGWYVAGSRMAVPTQCPSFMWHGHRNADLLPTSVP